MNNSEDRARLHGADCAQRPIPAPRAPAPAPAPTRGTPASPLPWSNVVDGWVRDSTVRRDALIGFTVALIAAVIVVATVTGALGPFLKLVMDNAAVRVVAGGVLTGGALGFGGLRLRRHLTCQSRGGGAPEPIAGAARSGPPPDPSVP